MAFDFCDSCEHPAFCGATPAACMKPGSIVNIDIADGVLFKPENATFLRKALPTQTTLEDSDGRLGEFNRQIQKVTDQRGEVYGHPSLDFHRVNRLKAVVAECADPLARHALEMICVKMARLIETPTHLDSWIDIAGYARTGVMVTEK